MYFFFVLKNSRIFFPKVARMELLMKMMMMTTRIDLTMFLKKKGTSTSKKYKKKPVSSSFLLDIFVFTRRERDFHDRISKASQTEYRVLGKCYRNGYCRYYEQCREFAIKKHLLFF